MIEISNDVILIINNIQSLQFMIISVLPIVVSISLILSDHLTSNRDVLLTYF